MCGRFFLEQVNALFLVHTSHFCCVEFNSIRCSIKCGRRDVAPGSSLNSELILANILVSEKCFKRRVIDILSDEGLKIFEKVFANGTKGRWLTVQQNVLEYFQAALGQEWPSFLFFFAGTNLRMLNTVSYNVIIRFDTAEIRRLNAPYGRKQKKATGYLPVVLTARKP